MKYRPEIDGLRAVAVLPVMVFHAGQPVLTGGYVGVDVFFVISGYLITTILLDDIEGGRFSIARFYERRVRRILPALFVVIAACVPFAWAWMLPDAFESFGQSVVATVLFSNNVLLWLTSGYFAQAAETKPLLHTWSLAVEEQFYILFPLLLAVLVRPGRIALAIAVLGVASFALMLWSVETGLPGADARFYLLPTRAWELLVGSAAALLLRADLPVPTRPVRSVLAGTGLAMIAAAMVMFDQGTDFPSLWTLLPVAGTVLVVLFAGRDEPVGCLLGHRVPVAVGLVSYSAYLWHQPVFVFYKLRTMEEITVPAALGLIVLALALAALTWRFVEQPFRRGSVPLLPRRGTLFATTAAAGLVLCAGGLSIHVTGGMPGRLDPAIHALIERSTALGPHQKTCQFGPWDVVPAHPVPACSEFMPSGAPEVIILGDSHAGAMARAIQESLIAEGLESYAVTYLGCPGLPGLYRVDLGPSHGCDAYAREMQDYVVASGAKAVVIAARWTIGWAGERFDNGEGGVGEGAPNPIDLVSHASDRAGARDPARRARFLEAIEAGLINLADQIPVVLVDPVPETGWRIPERMAKLNQSGVAGIGAEVTTSYAAYVARNRTVLGIFDRLDHPRIVRARIGPLFCDAQAGRCRATQGGIPLYSDNNHLSAAGAISIAPTVREAVRAAISATPQE
jgi:peptidoglycan/LPS O-acetylase OafA/YrhL